MGQSLQEMLVAHEAEIKELVAQDKRDEAGKKLFDLIVTCSQKGDLNNAKRLRDWFYDVNPMALGDIIKVNEVIDEAMSGSIDDDFSLAWSELKNLLTDEEFTSMFHCLKEHQVDKDKQILKTGSAFDAIFFVTKGNVNVICHSPNDKKLVQLTVLEPGSMISANCFEPSCWTMSLTSLSSVTLHALRRKEFEELSEQFPGFESKMLSFYEKNNSINALLREQQVNRRRFERFSVDYKITFQAVSKDGKAGDHIYKGDLNDISRQGLSFVFRIVKRENRRMLFGRRLLVNLQVDGKVLRFLGTAVAISVQDLQEHDYCVHMSLEKAIPEEVITFLAPPQEEEEVEEVEIDIDEGEEVSED